MKKDEVRLAADLQTDSIVDGLGIRTVIWFQGCSHNCKDCQNPLTHNFNGGFVIPLDRLLDEIAKLEGQAGITLSGGDPFFQPYQACMVGKKAHENNLSVWAYTGFTFEELLSKMDTNQDLKNMMNEIDVLIDGKFDVNKKTLNCRFRGSSNQRVLDLPKSIKEKKAIKYME